VSLGGVDPLDADHVAIAGRRVDQTELAKLAAGIGLMQPLADERRAAAG